ncbi:hypothetical protein ACYATP_07180 [Lactobacillaceae bacterium Melli_B4]
MYTTTIDLSVAHRRLYKYNPKLGGTDWRSNVYIRLFKEAMDHLACENKD